MVAVCGGGGGGGGAPPQVGGRSDPRTPPAKLHSAPPAAELCSACELLECGPTTLGPGWGRAALGGGRPRRSGAGPGS